MLNETKKLITDVEVEIIDKYISNNTNNFLRAIVKKSNNLYIICTNGTDTKYTTLIVRCKKYSNDDYSTYISNGNSKILAVSYNWDLATSIHDTVIMNAGYFINIFERGDY